MPLPERGSRLHIINGGYSYQPSPTQVQKKKQVYQLIRILACGRQVSGKDTKISIPEEQNISRKNISQSEYQIKRNSLLVC